LAGPGGVLLHGDVRLTDLRITLTAFDASAALALGSI
jgi:hypothetical protein